MILKRTTTALRTLCWLVFIATIGCLQQINANPAPGEWSNTIALTTLNGRLYSIETGGALYQEKSPNGKFGQSNRYLRAEGRNCRENCQRVSRV